MRINWIWVDVELTGSDELDGFVERADYKAQTYVLDQSALCVQPAYLHRMVNLVLSSASLMAIAKAANNDGEGAIESVKKCVELVSRYPGVCLAMG